MTKKKPNPSKRGRKPGAEPPKIAVFARVSVEAAETIAATAKRRGSTRSRVAGELIEEGAAALRDEVAP